jgi:radical SAM superfamily enzyme YgiQ (UPF0313 family)
MEEIVLIAENSSKNQKSTYQGFEQGPIRPPAEAQSLLLRLTRNCSWNRCTFCPLYKEERFSVRHMGHIIKDIDSIHHFITNFQQMFIRADRI